MNNDPMVKGQPVFDTQHHDWEVQHGEIQNKPIHHNMGVRFSL
jgi:hypothetical protein